TGAIGKEAGRAGAYRGGQRGRNPAPPQAVRRARPRRRAAGERAGGAGAAAEGRRSAVAALRLFDEGVEYFILLGGEGRFGDGGDQWIVDLEIDAEADAGAGALRLEHPAAVEVRERTVHGAGGDGPAGGIGVDAAGIGLGERAEA